MDLYVFLNSPWPTPTAQLLAQTLLVSPSTKAREISGSASSVAEETSAKATKAELLELKIMGFLYGFYMVFYMVFIWFLYGVLYGFYGQNMEIKPGQNMENKHKRWIKHIWLFMCF